MKTKEARTSARVDRIVRQSRAARMFEILIADDGSLGHVEAHGLLRLRADANERRGIHIAMSRGMAFEFGTPTEEIGGELRWRCDHRCGLRDGFCVACEMNEIYQSDQHLAAQRAKVGRQMIRFDGLELLWIQEEDRFSNTIPVLSPQEYWAMIRGLAADLKFERTGST